MNTEPVDSLLNVLHGSQDDLGVEVIGEFSHKLALDGQLLVHEGKVVLQLTVVGQHDALTLRVVLGPTRTTQHLPTYNMQSAKKVYFRVA